MQCNIMSSSFFIAEEGIVEYSLFMGKKKSEQICIRLEEEVYNKLKEIAEIEDRSIGYLIRKMVKESLGENISQKEEKKIKANGK